MASNKDSKKIPSSFEDFLNDLPPDISVVSKYLQPGKMMIEYYVSPKSLAKNHPELLRNLKPLTQYDLQIWHTNQKRAWWKEVINNCPYLSENMKNKITKGINTNFNIDYIYPTSSGSVQGLIICQGKNYTLPKELVVGTYCRCHRSIIGCYKCLIEYLRTDEKLSERIDFDTSTMKIGQQIICNSFGTYAVELIITLYLHIN